MQLSTLQNSYQFTRTALDFVEGEYTDVFSLKNNKSLAETLTHPRYAKFQSEVLARYRGNIEKPLGYFLLELKLKGDGFYRKFLNAYGDETYLCFRLENSDVRRARGICCYVIDGEIMYLSRCRDSMAKRIDQGYGKIHPKNCYIDGQATNCHLNSRLTMQASIVELWFCPLDSSSEIENVERDLVRAYNPTWNIQKFSQQP
jgi:hypothetical protein